MIKDIIIMLPFPVEIFGEVGNYLLKTDHERLRSCNQELWHFLPRYSKKIILTEVQTEFLNDLISSYEIRALEICGLPHAGTRYTLIVFCLWWLKNKGGRVIFITKDEKWRRMLEEMKDPYSSILFFNRALDVFRRRNRLKVTKEDLLINTTNNRSGTFATEIEWVPGKIFTGNIIFKKSILPLSSYPQYLLRSCDLFRTIDQLMETHSRVILIKKKKRLFDLIKENAKGKYTVIRGGKEEGSGKVLIVCEYDKLHRIWNLSGTIMVAGSLSFLSHPHCEIYSKIHSSIGITDIYWYTGRRRDSSLIKLAYSMMTREIVDNLFIAYGFHGQRMLIRKKLEKKSLFNRFKMHVSRLEDCIMWRNRDILKKIWEESHPMIDRLMSGSYQRY